MLIQFLVRTIGPILLRGGLGGGNTATTQSRNNIDDDFDDFDNDDDDDTKSSEVDDKSKVAISLPTFAPEKTDGSSSTATETASTLFAVTPTTDSSRINLLDSDFENQSTSTAVSQTTEDDFSFR